MYPVAGGTARFPHMAFDSVAGLGFGFFAYVQAVTIAPIEAFTIIVMAFMVVAIPVLAIIVLFAKFKSGNFTAGGSFMPGGSKALFGAIPGAGIVFAYSGVEQADQLAAKIKDPQKNLPRAIIMAVAIAVILRSRPAHLLAGLRGGLEAGHRPGHHLLAGRVQRPVLQDAAAAG